MKYYSTEFSSIDISRISKEEYSLHFNDILYCGHDSAGRYPPHSNTIKLILIKCSDKGHLMGIENFTIDVERLNIFYVEVLKVLEPAVERRATLYQRFSKNRTIEETKDLLRKFSSSRPEDQALLKNIHGLDFEDLKKLRRELPNFMSVLGKSIVLFTRTIDEDDFLIEGLNKLLSIINDCLEKKSPLYVFEKVTND